MKLSDQEKKMVARLQKQQLSWIRWRWVGLLGILISLGVGIFGFIILIDFPKDPVIPYLAAATIITPQIYVTFGAGGFLLV